MNVVFINPTGFKTLSGLLLAETLPFHASWKALPHIVAAFTMYNSSLYHEP